MVDDADPTGDQGGEIPVSYWAVEPRTAEDGFLDINFRVLKAGAPAEHRALKDNVESALSIINALYHSPSDRKKLEEAFAKLLALSQVGLVGKNASPTIAQDALRALEADITAREAGPVKNAYMRRLGKWALGFGGASFFMYFAINSDTSSNPQFLYNYRNIFLVLTGCMAGAWASFATRKVVLTFKDLVSLEEDKVEPQLRLIFTAILTTVLALAFVTKAVDIRIGEFLASSLKYSGSIALLIGAFAGLAEKALPSAVLAHAASIIPKPSPSK